MPDSQFPAVVRFDVFEIDLQAGELRKEGRKVKVPEQPFRVLSLLLQRPGQVVTREELREQLGYGLLFAATMGVIGSLLPAARAARLPIISALRQG